MKRFGRTLLGVFEGLLIAALLIGLVFGGSALIFASISGSNSIDVGKVAMLELPNGDIVVGEIEELYHWSRSYYEVTIGGETYYIHPSNFAIIPTDYPVDSSTAP